MPLSELVDDVTPKYFPRLGQVRMARSEIDSVLMTRGRSDQTIRYNDAIAAFPNLVSKFTSIDWLWASFRESKNYYTVLNAVIMQS